MIIIILWSDSLTTDVGTYIIIIKQKVPDVWLVVARFRGLKGHCYSFNNVVYSNEIPPCISYKHKLVQLIFC